MHGYRDTSTINITMLPSRMVVLWQVLGTIVAWVGLFKLNAWLFGYFEWTRVISWIFLPAAVRLLCVVLFDWRGALGLWFGTLVTNIPVFGDDFLQSIAVATISAAGPLAAMYCTMRFLNISMDLRGLTSGKLTIFALIAALCNALPHNLYFWIADIASSPFSGLAPMFVGDVSGTVLVLYTLRAMLVVSEHFVRLPTR